MMTEAATVIRFGAVGDMIILTPLLRALADRHGEPCRVVGRGSYLSELYSYLPCVGECRSIASRKTPYWFSTEQRELVAWLRGRPGPLYIVESDAKTRSLCRRAGRRAEAVIADLPRGATEHVVHHHARLAGFADDCERDDDYRDGYEPWLELRVLAEEVAQCRRWLAEEGMADHNLTLIQPGNRRTMQGRGATVAKDWPIERWVALAKGIRSWDGDSAVLICGAPSEQPLALEIAAAAGTGVHAIADRLPLRRLFALQRLACCMISVDTGPAHAAAAVGCPLVVLFGAVDPRMIRPLSRTTPVRVVTGPDDAPAGADADEWARLHRMEAIEVDAVLAAWRDILGFRPVD